MIGLVAGLLAEARIAAPLGEALAGGGTTEGARQAAEALVRRGATSLISFGLAGGLDPALRPGALVVPAAVVTRTARFPADPGLLAALGGATHAGLAAAAAVVVTAEAKRRLRACSGADAVDMESAAVAEVAGRHGLRFAVLRAVCDPAERTLPPAALVALDRSGAIGIVRVLRSLAGRPSQFPDLLALARDAARARAALVRRVGDLRPGWPGVR